MTGDMTTDFSNSNLGSTTPNAPIKLNFKSNKSALGSTVVNYAAIIYDDGKCNGNIIAIAGSPHYSPGYSAPSSTAFTALITAGTTSFPKLELNALPSKYKNPFYTQDFPCSDKFGNAVNNSTSKCGRFLICIEFQMLDGCGRKLDFVDVQVQIEFDLLESCSGDFCGEVRFQRDPLVLEGTDVNIGSVECFPCRGQLDPTHGNLPAIKVGQGSSVDMCFKVTPNVAGVCIVKVERFVIEVTRPGGVKVIYPVLPSGLYLVDYPPSPVRSNPDYKPPANYYPVIGIDANGKRSQLGSSRSSV
jgi:hypothetical protein